MFLNLSIDCVEVMQAAKHPRANTLSGMSARSASVWVSYTGEKEQAGAGRRDS